MHRLLLAATILLVASACDGASDAVPPLLGLPEVPIADLRTTAPRPGRYNVTGVVIGKTSCECPPDADCAPCDLPTGLVVSETGAPLPAGGYDAADSTVVFVEVRPTDPFVVGATYRLSVAVGDETPLGRPVRITTLLGAASLAR